MKDEDSVHIKPATSIRGKVQVPGDKSISHRALLLGSISSGVTTVRNLAPGEDVTSTLFALKTLGVEIRRSDGEVRVEGRGIGGLEEPEATVEAGNSGTLMRLLSGLLAGHNFSARLDGDDSLRERPMERIIDPLEKMGAVIKSNQGTAPLDIQGGDLRGIAYETPVASAQVKSSILLAGLHAEGTTTVREPGPSRDHTEVMLASMGWPLEVEGRKVTLEEGKTLTPLDVNVPGDLSSAAYHIAAALISEDAEIVLRQVGLNETRTGFLNLVTRMGADVEYSNTEVLHGERRGDLHVKSSNLHGIQVSGEQVVTAIDELPLLALLAAQAEGVTEVNDAEELRVKETDRIRAVVANMREMGVDMEEREDGFRIEGPQQLSGGRLESYGDHRIAMTFTLAALAADSHSELQGTGCVAVSYPSFFDHLEALLSD